MFDAIVREIEMSDGGAGLGQGRGGHRHELVEGLWKRVENI